MEDKNYTLKANVSRISINLYYIFQLYLGSRSQERYKNIKEKLDNILAHRTYNQIETSTVIIFSIKECKLI